MLFPIPDPALWDQPNGFPFSNLKRRLWHGPLFPVNQEWVDQYYRYWRRIQLDQEEWENYLEQKAAYEAMMAEYEEQGHYMAGRLPIYLHHLRLSHRRTVQERKSERVYEQIDYCAVAEWNFDESAYYFNIVTWPLPYGVSIADFKQEPVADTLSINFGSKVMIEVNERNHQRPGLWIVVEHKAGRGAIPGNISYQQALAQIPKTASSLAIPVGQGAHGSSYIIDLALITNLLAGGTQGGGKSNFLNVLLSTLISRNSPDHLRLFLIDFKRVEFAFYKGIKHLGGDVNYLKKMTVDKEGNEHWHIAKTIGPDYQPREDESNVFPPMGKHIITEPDEVVPLLDYVIEEIERRTSMFEGKVRNIKSWNKRFPKRRLAYWYIIVDELADVMLQPRFGKKVEERLVRISQKGRAEGIGLVLCTQTPNNKVVSMLIQQNIPTRMVFFCGTGIASGTMLDGGYEAARLPRIPGRGLVREGQVLTEVQTPEISDWTVRAAVKAAKSETPTEQIDINKYPHIDPEKVFKFALDNCQGACVVRDIYNHFKKQGVPQDEIENLLFDHEVKGETLELLHPTIEINDQIYYLAPPASKYPRQLVEVEYFERQFETHWKEILVSRVLRLAKTGLGVTRPVSKISSAADSAEIQTPEEVID